MVRQVNIFPRGPIGFMIRLGIVLCLMAYAAGGELRHEAVEKQVPINSVPSDTCMANGKIEYVTMHPVQPGVYWAHCQSGVILVAPGRNGK